MHGLHPAALPVLLTTISLLGLASAWFVRRGEGRAPGLACQFFFFACWGSLSLATAGLVLFGAWLWFLPGGTLGAMIVAATCDRRMASEAV